MPILRVVRACCVRVRLLCFAGIHHTLLKLPRWGGGGGHLILPQSHIALTLTTPYRSTQTDHNPRQQQHQRTATTENGVLPAHALKRLPPVPVIIRHRHPADPAPLSQRKKYNASPHPLRDAKKTTTNPHLLTTMAQELVTAKHSSTPADTKSSSPAKGTTAATTTIAPPDSNVALLSTPRKSISESDCGNRPSLARTNNSRGCT